MSRSQKILIGLAATWLAAATVAGLILLRESIGHLPVVLAVVAMVVLTPLAIITFAWLSLRPSPPALSLWVSILVSPWIAAGVALALGAAILAEQRSQQQAWEDALRQQRQQWQQEATQAARKYWAHANVGWALLHELVSDEPLSDVFYGDSVTIEDFRVRFSPRYDGDGEPLRITAVLRNRSASTILLRGYWGQYLSARGEVIGDFGCDCGFSRSDLRPGYVADIDARIPLGPSPARRDAVTFFVVFTVPK